MTTNMTPYHITAFNRLTDEFCHREVVAISRFISASDGQMSIRFFMRPGDFRRTTTTSTETNTGRLFLGSHWKVIPGGIGVRSLRLVRPSVQQILRRRARNLRALGIGPEIASKLVRDHYLEEG